MVRARRQLGAPGVYDAPAASTPTLQTERMDVCAFVGVSPRGPATPPTFEAPWAPRPDRPVRSVVVPVDGFESYRAQFGGFEGPGRLPYAVAAFFDNGGEKAYVVRVVAPLDPLAPSDGVARAPLQGLSTESGRQVWLRARSEGAWGDRLSVNLRSTWRAVAVRTSHSTTSTLALPLDSPLTLGSHVRCELPGGARVVRRVDRVEPSWTPGSSRRALVAELSSPIAAVPTRCEVLKGTLTVFEDGSPRETFEELGFGREHPRFVARVLVQQSKLVYPAVRARGMGAWQDARWEREDLQVGLQGVSARIERLVDGEDRYSDLRAEHFFSDWVPGDEVPGDGVHAIVELRDLGMLVVPDLYVPQPLEERRFYVPESLAGPTFEPCRTEVQTVRSAAVDLVVRATPAVTADNALADVARGTPLTVVPDAFEVFDIGAWLHVFGVSTSGATVTGWVAKAELESSSSYVLPPPDLDGLRLDPNADFDAVVRLQARLLALAEQLRGPTVLLDVPPGLSEARIERWRAAFDSAFAAGYYPWLRAPRADDPRDEAIDLNPSAVAAGILARKERTSSVTHGPANEVARGVVDVAEVMRRGVEDRLHPVGVNVFRLDRDGVRLLGARTLSLDTQVRQLSVRRTLTMIERALQRQMGWLVFEPNHEGTWRDLRHTLSAFLRRLHRNRAFKGKTEQEAFFVRCDGSLNDIRAQDQGRLYAEVGVALAEPVEFIVLQVVRSHDAVQVEGPL